MNTASMNTSGAAIRALAANTVVAVLEQGRSLRPLLAERLPSVADPRDRALLEALVFAVLRHRRRYEYVIDSWVPRPLPTAQNAVRALLLVGLAQLDALHLPVHAALSATAEATRTLGQPKLVGLVNGLLRRATREPWPQSSDDAIRHSHPNWLLRTLRRDWPDHWPQILVANNEQAPLWLRVNARRASREVAKARLAEAGIDAHAPAYPTMALRIDHASSPTTLPGWDDGWLSVHDGSAQLAIEALAPQAGERILDACAAPGGKSAQLLEAGDGIALTAIDLEAARLARVQQTLDRLGHRDAVTLIAGDAAQPSRWWDNTPFDAILLDAPCSATGIIRRQPDIKWNRRASDLPALIKTQARLLKALWPLLRPGGRMLYATCSLLAAENHAQIAAFLARTADAQAVPLDARYGYVSGAGRQRLPGEDGMDGFFYALLVKQHR
ncbi:MAG: 16S rRNA (cytosine(967)-C(5))-methyltransferase [Lysobacterales bacterium CG17_big_fil_post_rev_8_21_14_2_50_64_11]|nr:MAG: 16S rRNA (cytosine(967)-C(5))-methyltransferase [Xanthomonadales bacterium CG17_big_fil_post_rev_8_21_14_2_50_64_11]PIX59917.1 MAG: 16S rRNA (cytosine(967)-C(5))-methyltransferase [Xanthomonadales bacterium CG_4_10_14_3_um_filter_64_11]